MQHHHPGSWYLPWGVPLQKMLMTIPHHQAAGMYHADANGATGPAQMPTSPNYPLAPAGAPSQVMSHSQGIVQRPPPPQSQHSPTATTGLHLSGHRSGPYQAANHMHHHSLHHHHQLPQQIHPHAAAAAMFTPISLRSFLGHSSHNMSHPMPQVQPPANSPLGNASMPQIPTMSLNVGVLPMTAGGRHGGAGGPGMACNGSMGSGGGGLMAAGVGQTGLSSSGCALGMNNHNNSGAAAAVVGSSLLMPMKKVTTQ